MADDAGMTAVGKVRASPLPASLPLAALLILSACSDPTLSAGITLDADGIGVTPSVSGNVAGLGLSVGTGLIR